MDDLRASRRRAELLTAGLRFVTDSMLGLLGLIVIDAFWPLPATLRLALLIAAPLALSLGWLWLGPSKSDDERARLHQARRLEHTDQVCHNTVLNALQLRTTPSTTPLGHALTSRTADRARALLTRLPPRSDQQRISLRRHTGNLWVVGLLGTLLAFLQPNLVGGGMLRLLMPLGDHPPFSLTHFDVEINPSSPKAGQTVRVDVQRTGPGQKPLELVELDASNNPTRRWPMSRNPKANKANKAKGGAFQHRFASLTQPMHFQIESGSARTHRYTIIPRARTKANGADSSASPQSTENSQSPATQGRTKSQGQNRGGQLIGDLPRLFEEMRQLLTQASRLSRQALKLQGQRRQLAKSATNAANPSTPTRRVLARKQRQLHQALKNLAHRATTAARHARHSASGLSSSAMTAAMKDLAKILERMSARITTQRLANAANASNPSKPMHVWPFDAGKDHPADDTANPGSVAGKSGGMPSTAGPAKIADTARASAQAIRKALKRLDRAVRASSSGQRSQGQVNPSALGLQPTPSLGPTIQQRSTAVPEAGVPEALMDKVPAEYRDLTGRYFLRIRRDEQNRPGATSESTSRANQ